MTDQPPAIKNLQHSLIVNKLMKDYIRNVIRASVIDTGHIVGGITAINNTAFDQLSDFPKRAYNIAVSMEAGIPASVKTALDATLETLDAHLNDADGTKTAAEKIKTYEAPTLAAKIQAEKQGENTQFIETFQAIQTAVEKYLLELHREIHAELDRQFGPVGKQAYI